MSTSITTLESYLHETWSPDREFVDGEILERTLGEKDHSSWQMALSLLLASYRHSANIRVFPELRLQTQLTRFRVPDIMVIDRNAPNEQIITHPPLLCVEILSPDDRLHHLTDKVAEYFQMGVRAVWIIDTRKQVGYQCSGPAMHDWNASPVLSVPDTSISIEMSAIIADLD